jgi:hypothetical protein
MVVPKVNSPVSDFVLPFRISKKLVNAIEFFETKAMRSPLFTIKLMSLNKTPSVELLLNPKIKSI